ncbi:hypothetical protein [Bradyrhizobium ottawaense]|uniref:hypothetical protein n=1 Tax=Bradyrhizobium ottawaense TaxID=931866 RepID=UPI0035157DF2
MSATARTGWVHDMHVVRRTGPTRQTGASTAELRTLVFSFEKHVVVAILGVDETFRGLWARDHSSMFQQLRSIFAKLLGFEAERAAIKMLIAVIWSTVLHRDYITPSKK